MNFRLFKRSIGVVQRGSYQFLTSSKVKGEFTLLIT